MVKIRVKGSKDADNRCTWFLMHIHPASRNVRVTRKFRRALRERAAYPVAFALARHIIRGLQVNGERMMTGYYYDWVAEQWREGQSTELTRIQRRRNALRRTLLVNLLTEIRAGHDSIATLYAGLLARQLITSDETLMREFGRDVVNQTGNAAHDASSSRNESRIGI